MKKILLTLTAVLIAFLAVSCNMDSSTGLFQEAGQSVKKESYVIRKVIAADEADSIYLVAADEGIFLYDAKANKKVGATVANGRTSRNVIGGFFTEAADTSKWKCIYYDDPSNKGDGKYHCIDQDGNVTAFSGLENYIPVSSVYEGGNTVIVFRNSEKTTNYVCMTKLTSSSQDFSSVKDTSLTNVSYIGDGYFIGVDTDRKYITDTSKSINVYFKYTASGVFETPEVNSSSYITHEDATFLSLSDTFYKADGSSIGSISSNYTYTRANAATDGNTPSSSYFILSGLNSVYKITDGKMEAKNVSSLSSIEVVYIASVADDGSYINVITAESGAKCINITDGKIDSSWK